MIPEIPQTGGTAISTASLQRGTTPPPNKYPGYDNKQSDSEAPLMLELWGMRSTPSLPSLPDPLWTGVVAPDRVLSMGQIGLNCPYVKLNCMKDNCFDNKTTYLCYTELFEIELFLTLKLYLLSTEYFKIKLF